MVEKFIAGMQYCATIVVSASGKGKLNALEQALPEFEKHGVSADIKNSSLSSVTLDVYVALAAIPKKLKPPLITRQTAEAYESLIQKIREFGYTDIEETRDLRTGLGNSKTPLFEIIETESN